MCELQMVRNREEDLGGSLGLRAYKDNSYAESS